MHPPADSSTRNPESRFAVLDTLRAVAALLVAWFHFTKNVPGLAPDAPVRVLGRYGFLGVEVFFVISGFVIPWALYRSRYTLRSFGRFMVRRLVRLDPPYLVAIAITVALGYLSAMAPGYHGAPYEVTLPQLAYHLGFLNVFGGYPWVNEVFWTLAIEFQFYVMVALLFPAFASGNPYVRWGSMMALAMVGIATQPPGFLFAYTFIFLTGILTFQLKAGFVGRGAYAAAVAVAFVGTTITLAVPNAIAGILTAMAIIFATRGGGRVLTFLGTLSYSLYLLHVPVGLRVINLGARLPSGASHPYVLIAAALLVSVAAAWVLNRLVERPAQRLASSIAYGKTRQPRIEAASL